MDNRTTMDVMSPCFGRTNRFDPDFMKFSIDRKEAERLLDTTAMAANPHVVAVERVASGQVEWFRAVGKPTGSGSPPPLVGMFVVGMDRKFVVSRQGVAVKATETSSGRVLMSGIVAPHSIAAFFGLEYSCGRTPVPEIESEEASEIAFSPAPC